jgi:DNA-binding transcriptional MocR family regulator
MTQYHTEQAITCHVLKGASGSAARVYDYLRNAQAEAERHGRMWITPRLATIAADIGRCVRTVARAYAWLQARGAIVKQRRFYRDRAGRWRQISNRVRVMVTTLQAAARAALMKARAAELARVRYRSDIPDRLRIKGSSIERPKSWQSSPTYRNLMQKGLWKRE